MATASQGAKKLRVLVADDGSDVATWLSVLLSHNGYDVRPAMSGEEALTVAERFRPQVALIDIGMPGLDGYEVARRLRATAWGRAIMLVAVTGWADAEHERRSQEAGFHHHWVKPVLPERLLKLLAEVAASPPA